ncbi:hypothetical protein R6Q57_013331 [Mikania cordata]
MGHQKAIDYDLLTQLGKQQRMMAIIGEDTPWSRLFDMTYAPQYRLLTVEFLSTFIFRPQAPDFQPEPGQLQPAEISFKLCGDSYVLSLREFAMETGLYTKAETYMPIYTTTIHTIDDAVVSAWFIDIDPVDMEDVYHVRLDSRTVHSMRIVQKFPRLVLRFALETGVIWQRGQMICITEMTIPCPSNSHRSSPRNSLHHMSRGSRIRICHISPRNSSSGYPAPCCSTATTVSTSTSR